MALLPNVPLSFSADLNADTNAKRTQFGDRQSQRFRMGMRPVVQKWKLQWNNITEIQKETLRSYFVAIGGTDTFQWTPPGQTVELNFICNVYREKVQRLLWDVEIEAEQVFYQTTPVIPQLLFGSLGLTASVISDTVQRLVEGNLTALANVTGSLTFERALAGNLSMATSLVGFADDVGILGMNADVVGALTRTATLSGSLVSGNEITGTLLLGQLGGTFDNANNIAGTLEVSASLGGTNLDNQNNVTGTLTNEAAMAGNLTSGGQITGSTESTVALGGNLTMTNQITGAPNWSPTDIGSALVVWYDFDDANTQTFSSTAITQITNKGSLSNRTLSQSLSGERPTTNATGLNNRRTAVFSGGQGLRNDNLDPPLANAAHLTFVVYRTNGTTTAGQALYDYFNRDTIYIEANTGNAVSFIGPDATNSGLGASVSLSGVAANAWHILGVRDQSAANTQFYLNGTATTTGTNQNRGTTAYSGSAQVGMTIGYFKFANGGLTGQIAEYLEVGGDVTLDTIQRIEGYLAHKWGLTAGLPTNHPYKNAPP